MRQHAFRYWVQDGFAETAMGLALLIGGAVTLVGSWLLPQWPELTWGLQTLGWTVVAGSVITGHHRGRLREGGGYVEPPVSGAVYGLLLAAVMFVTMMVVDRVVPERFYGTATEYGATIAAGELLIAYFARLPRYVALALVSIGGAVWVGLNGWADSPEGESAYLLIMGAALLVSGVWARRRHAGREVGSGG